MVEISRGSRNKYGIGHDSGLIRLLRTPFTATQYPADYGFVRDTVGEDGDLLRARVLSTLGELAADDEHHARLRDTLLVFLDTGGSCKTTAERLVPHKNTARSAGTSIKFPGRERTRPDLPAKIQSFHGC